MIGRGSFGNPWVFEQGNAALEGREIPPLPPLTERMDTAMAQLRMAVELKGVPRSGEYKKDIIAMNTLADAERIVRLIRLNLR